MVAATKPSKKKPSTATSTRPAASSKPQSHPLEGTPAPAFSLPADDGTQVSLASLLGKRVVLFFYPKDNTPGCTREACGFQAQLAAMEAKGAVVLGVSRDSARTHLGFKQKQGLTYPLLTDADTAVHLAYGAWGKKVLYGKEHDGCIRTTVLIDAKGQVARVFSPVKVDGHAEAVLEALDLIS